MVLRPLKALMIGTYLACGCLLGAGFGLAQSNDAPITSRPLGPPPASITLDVENRNAPDGDVFRVGFLADAAPGHQRSLYLPFRSHLEAVLSRPVELVPFRDARGLMMAIQRQDIGYAMAPSSVFAATHRLCACVTPLGTQPNRDGSQGLFSVLLALEGGSIGGLDDAADARLAIVGEGSVVAHRVGLSELWRTDLQLSPENVLFTETLQEAADALAAGQADAILSWSRQADGRVMFDREPASTLSDEVRSNLRVVWRSRPVPGYTHFTHLDLPEPLSETLQAMLIELTGRNGDAFDAIDQGSGRGFVARDLGDYDPLLEAFVYWDGANQAAN